jgi:cysteine desulfurase / selenocysteine lyase
MGVGLSLDRPEIDAIRRLFPALQQYTWFQNGGVSITPKPVADEHAVRMAEILTRGPVHIVYPEEEYPRRRRSIERLAHFWGVDADEIALMRGVSEAFQTVIRGIDWRAGDRILISEDEEAALLLAVLHLRDRHGVEVVKIPLVDDAQAQVQAAIERMDERTRLVALSLVSTDAGWRLPVGPICAEARRRGILSFVDTAHAVGLYPLGVRQLECDFAGLLSYKWMYAPYASGALFCRREKLDAVEVRYAGGRSQKWLDFEADRFELHEGADRFQFGPWSWPLVHAWAEAVGWLDQIGLERIWERTVLLTQRLKQGLQQVPGAEIYTPLAVDMSAALVSFGVAGWTGKELAIQLRQHWNLIIKPLPHGREGLRASLPFFLLEQEIDALVAALAELADQRRKGAL